MSFDAYRDVFAQRIGRLNDAQRQAVMHTEGPTMVIAGPGTGKTEVLGARIAHILHEGLASPKSILCLTYTTAGVTAMRKRLLEYIGPEAYNIEIHTFHSFCQKVIQENKEIFGSHLLDHLSELEEIELLESMTNKIKPGNPLYSGEMSGEIWNLRDLFRTMKAEHWSVEDIHRAADEYIQSLPNNEEYIYKRAYGKYKKGDLKEAKIKEQERRMNRLKAGADLFTDYQSRLKKAHKYDYQDMILWVLDAFKNNDWLLSAYQEQFLYIHIDEYQDTNGAQNDLISQLTNYWEAPNVFIVGDEDQSIYRFQGANLRNIESFYNQYKDTVKVVVLDKNYRSTESILEPSRLLIEQNHERLTEVIPNLKKHLEAANENLQGNFPTPVVTEYFNSAHEEVDIVSRLEKMYQSGEDLDEIAVIYRNHAQVENMVRSLEKKKIPVRIKEPINILDLPFIQNVLLLMEYLQREYDDPYKGDDVLFRLMHFQVWGISVADIARCMAYRRSYQRNHEGEYISLRQILTEIQHLDQLQLDDKEKLMKLGQQIESWLGEMANVPLLPFFESLLSKGNILAYSLESENEVWYMKLLTTFFHWLKDEVRKDPSMNLVDMMDKISRMRKHGIKLAINKISFQEKGISFLTAHSAKGLEFRTVFLMGATQKVWDKKRRGNGYSYPDTLTQSNQGSDIEESRRLWYVAMTRTKENLFVSYPAQDLEGKELLPSQFVVEILNTKKLLLHKESKADIDLGIYHHDLLHITPEKPIYILPDAYIDEVLENYSLSATHLNTYLRCPRAFYFEYILRVPTMANMPMAFGQGMHYALEKAFSIAEKQGSLPKAETITLFFDQVFEKYRGNFIPDVFTARQAYGHQVIEQYLAHYEKKSLSLKTKREYSIRTHIGEAPVNGKLDKLEFLDSGKVKVVDYKTGKYRKNKIARPKNEEDLGTDYWRQMVFYALLLDNSDRDPWRMEEGEFDFVEPDKDTGEFHKAVMDITHEDKAIVRSQVADTYQNIMAHKFHTGCGECEWCGFVANQYNRLEV